MLLRIRHDFEKFHGHFQAMKPAANRVSIEPEPVELCGHRDLIGIWAG
jgi:hypothetical protein